MEVGDLISCADRVGRRRKCRDQEILYEKRDEPAMTIVLDLSWRTQLSTKLLSLLKNILLEIISPPVC